MSSARPSRFKRGTLAIATSKSQNRKLGNAATTYAAQTSCPTSCRFYDGGGCYAEAGSVGMFVTRPLNAAARAVAHTPLDVAIDEAAEIDKLEASAGRALRLHTVGDCATAEAAREVSAAAKRYRERGGGPVWTYTHAWRTVPRAAWGEVSVLASCESEADADAARARGYAPAMVVPKFAHDRRHVVDAPGTEAHGADILPCPQQTRGRTCTDCRLCFDDKRLLTTGYSIAFELHGTPFTMRQAKKALLDRDDPDRKLTLLQLLPRAIAELEAEGKVASNATLARRLNCSPSSVSQARKKLAAQVQ